MNHSERQGGNYGEIWVCWHEEVGRFLDPLVKKVVVEEVIESVHRLLLLLSLSSPLDGGVY